MSVALAYLSLGSNLGDRRQNLLFASGELARAGVEVVRSSSIYETEPQDFAGQPAFLNLVLAVKSEFSPFQLLQLTQDIEAALGRTPSEVPKGPRLIDVDILLYGNSILTHERLTIPHPRMTGRRFVLEPLIEIAPEIRHPETDVPFREFLKNVSSQRVEKLASNFEETPLNL